MWATIAAITTARPVGMETHHEPPSLNSIQHGPIRSDISTPRKVLGAGGPDLARSPRKNVEHAGDQENTNE